jgi:hypothetical protein
MLWVAQEDHLLTLNHPERRSYTCVLDKDTSTGYESQL